MGNSWGKNLEALETERATLLRLLDKAMEMDDANLIRDTRADLARVRELIAGAEVAASIVRKLTLTGESDDS